MRKLLIISGFFVLMLAMQIKFTPVAEAGINMPIFGTLICQYKSNNKTYVVSTVDLAMFEEMCLIDVPEECDANETCSDCLSKLSESGYEIDLSSEVSNNRVEYTLSVLFEDFSCDGEEVPTAP